MWVTQTVISQEGVNKLYDSQMGITPHEMLANEIQMQSSTCVLALTCVSQNCELDVKSFLWICTQFATGGQEKHYCDQCLAIRQQCPSFGQHHRLRPQCRCLQQVGRDSCGLFSKNLVCHEKTCLLWKQYWWLHFRCLFVLSLYFPHLISCVTVTTAFLPQVRSSARLECPVCVRDRRVWHGYREQGTRGGADTTGDLWQVPCHALRHLQVVSDWLWLLWKNHHWEADRVRCSIFVTGSRCIICCYWRFLTLVRPGLNLLTLAVFGLKWARFPTITIQLRNTGLL